MNRDYLMADELFDSLLEELEAALAASDEKTVRFGIEPPDGRYIGNDVLLKRLGCKRASWAIPLDSVLLDKFFNGLMGIRAQYYISPYHGAAMNNRLLSALRNRLVELAQAVAPSVERQFVELSVDAQSVKVWVSEKTLNGHKIIRASDLSLEEEEIQNDWLDLARSLKAGELRSDQYQLYSATLNGVRAPIADQLQVKGAWITSDDRRDYVTPDKRDRDTQLFMFGFT